MKKIQQQKICPFLWFDKNAAEAAKFYVSVFKNSRIIQVSPLVVTFELEGMRFMGLNGGPHFKFTEAVSFYVNCETQKEVDYFWEKLSKGGNKSQCGWLKDKFGLSWQIVPGVLGELIGGKDRAGADRALQAMLKMKKLDIKKLQKAYAGK
jgi:predicted 3-demethylubiquinone-9 3-methyltransferase (glyoxalase superfamily)